jgi:flagellar motor protein MotB
MPRRSNGQSDDGPPGVGEWIVTFSDCMTLLLCFFVMLLTFSSFDESALQKFDGAFPIFNDNDSLDTNRTRQPDSDLEPPPTVTDETMHGSDSPTGRPGPTVNPRITVALPQTDAYRDRRVFYLPSAMMFHGKGWVLTPTGKEMLDILAGYMRKVPCRVVLSESSTTARLNSRDRRIHDNAVHRPWVAMNHLVGLGIPAKWFNVALAVDADAPTDEGDVLQIALLARSPY